MAEHLQKANSVELGLLLAVIKGLGYKISSIGLRMNLSSCPGVTSLFSGLSRFLYSGFEVVSVRFGRVVKQISRVQQEL